MPIDLNTVGNRGESIFMVRVLTLHGGKPLFRAAFLGEKWAVADCVVELFDAPGCFFLAQVKSTTLGVNRDGRLRAQVAKEKYNALAALSLPTYVVGVDDTNEEAYVSAAVYVRERKLSSISTLHSLREPRVRQILHDEVLRFWNQVSTGVPWTTPELEGE